LAANKSNTNNSLPDNQNLPAKGHNYMFFNVLHSLCDCSALTLFVAPIFTDDAHNTIATDDLAVAADTLD
jgi:hypothetical protein